ncbi:MAG: FAD-dependent oxidoreductase [Acidimicrobiales bacterium]
MSTADCVVIGAGLAGVSVAAELANRGLRVTVVEMEPTMAFHTTGRSAAQYLANYGNEVVRRLTAASATYFASHPQVPLWAPRACLRVGSEAHEAQLSADAAVALTVASDTRFVDGAEARRLVPALAEHVTCGVLEPGAMELDVAAIHQSYVATLRSRAGIVRTSSPAVSLSRHQAWSVELADGEVIDTPTVVNAAGAWGDEVARRAGVSPVGLHPLRRSVGIVGLPAEVDTAGWPLVAFENDDGVMAGYCKPEPGGLLVSPADETPSAPCDARPDEIDIALGLDALNHWLTLDVHHVTSTWAGLRTFAADRSPVVGEAPDAAGFHWCVGQGGYGIQMAPALARAAAALVVDGELPTDLSAAGLTPADLAPDRPTLAGPLIAEH